MTNTTTIATVAAAPIAPEHAECHAEIMLELATALEDASAGDRIASASKQIYTSAILATLAAFHHDVGDDVGANLLEEMAKVFARHEASVV